MGTFMDSAQRRRRKLTGALMEPHRPANARQAIADQRWSSFTVEEHGVVTPLPGLRPQPKLTCSMVTKPHPGWHL